MAFLFVFLCAVSIQPCPLFPIYFKFINLKCTTKPIKFWSESVAYMRLLLASFSYYLIFFLLFKSFIFSLTSVHFSIWTLLCESWKTCFILVTFLLAKLCVCVDIHTQHSIWPKISNFYDDDDLIMCGALHAFGGKHSWKHLSLYVLTLNHK